MKQNGGNYAKVIEIHHNHHPFGVKLLAKSIRRGNLVDI